MKKQMLQQLSDNRTEAENILFQKFGYRHFYDEQWKTIQRLLRGERMLLIERTGYGKSLCYQYPATLFDGITVVFSPLIALMRDQVNFLDNKGIRAVCINSERTVEENEEAIKLALQGQIKILYIAPERQENQSWRSAALSMNLSMVVVDEAHTISVWGHDFRPSFRRIVNLVNLLPIGTPLLATTATATARVQKDIETQLGQNIQTVRGSLIRSNFRLHVIEVKSEDEKLIWMARNIDRLPGTGLVYTGTRVDTDVYSRWLQFIGVNAIGYNAGMDSELRKEIECGLMDNRWKCIVSTNALGMGIDKPDIRFVIHTQMPASPIHYYQEIGRSGRDGKTTYAILFFNSKNEDGDYVDCRLPKAFVNNARPKAEVYHKVINYLKENMLGEREVLKIANIKQLTFRVIRADLIEQGIIKEVTVGRLKKYQYQYNAPQLDTSGFEELRLAKLKDLSSMVEYVFTKEPRMKFLCNYLGDYYSGPYTGCDNTTEERWLSAFDQRDIEKVYGFRESYFPTIKCTEKGNNIIDGVAASLYGVSNVGATIHRCKYESGGDFPDYLLRLTLKAYRKTFGSKKLDMVMFVPPTISGNLVEKFAEKLSKTLQVPISYALKKARATEAQKIFNNAYLKRDNVKDSFSVDDGTDVKDKTVLLVDDIYDSGATLKEIGKLLTSLGAVEIVPLVIAKTVGSDND